MRRLAIFTGAFSLGIFLAQYLLPAPWLLPCAGASFLLAWGRLLLPPVWGRRVLLAGTGLALAAALPLVRGVMELMAEMLV